MAVLKAVHSKAKLSVAVNYITKQEKTETRLVSGINCDPMSAVTEMETTKRLWRKTGGRQYDHYIQSFAPAEPVTPEQAHRIVAQWAEKQFQGYECLIATHIDRDHVHSHILVNSVSYQTGKKLHTSAKWLQEAKDYSDKLCRQEGLSVCVKNQTYEGKERTEATTWTKGEHQLLEKATRKEAYSFLLDIAIAVCTVLKTALNRQDFVEKLLEYGIATSWTDKQKYITFTDLEGNKVRNKRLTNTFHYDFSKESLEHEFTKRSREEAERESQNAHAEVGGIPEGTPKRHEHPVQPAKSNPHSAEPAVPQMEESLENSSCKQKKTSKKGLIACLSTSFMRKKPNRTENPLTVGWSVKVLLLINTIFTVFTTVFIMNLIQSF